VGKATMVRTTVVKTHSRQRELNPTPVEPPTVRHLPLEHACSQPDQSEDAFLTFGPDHGFCSLSCGRILACPHPLAPTYLLPPICPHLFALTCLPQPLVRSYLLFPPTFYTPILHPLVPPSCPTLLSHPLVPCPRGIQQHTYSTPNQHTIGGSVHPSTNETIDIPGNLP
jgi:hypothetical protein